MCAHPSDHAPLHSGWRAKVDFSTLGSLALPIATHNENEIVDPPALNPIFSDSGPPPPLPDHPSLLSSHFPCGFSLDCLLPDARWTPESALATISRDMERVIAARLPDSVSGSTAPLDPAAASHNIVVSSDQSHPSGTAEPDQHANISDGSRGPTTSTADVTSSLALIQAAAEYALDNFKALQAIQREPELDTPGAVASSLHHWPAPPSSSAASLTVTSTSVATAVAMLSRDEPAAIQHLARARDSGLTEASAGDNVGASLDREENEDLHDNTGTPAHRHHTAGHHDDLAGCSAGSVPADSGRPSTHSVENASALREDAGVASVDDAHASTTTGTAMSRKGSHRAAVGDSNQQVSAAEGTSEFISACLFLALWAARQNPASAGVRVKPVRASDGTAVDPSALPVSRRALATAGAVSERPAPPRSRANKDSSLPALTRAPALRGRSSMEAEIPAPPARPRRTVDALDNQAEDESPHQLVVADGPTAEYGALADGADVGDDVGGEEADADVDADDVDESRMATGVASAAGAPDDAMDGALDADKSARALVCPVCGGPGRNPIDSHCQGCYTSLWKDARRVAAATMGPKGSGIIWLTGERDTDLERFTHEVEHVGKRCITGAFQCDASFFAHRSTRTSKCTRCRTKLAIQLLPALAFRQLCVAFREAEIALGRESTVPLAVIMAASAPAIGVGQPRTARARGSGPKRATRTGKRGLAARRSVSQDDDDMCDDLEGDEGEVAEDVLEGDGDGEADMVDGLAGPIRPELEDGEDGVERALPAHARRGHGQPESRGKVPSWLTQGMKSKQVRLPRVAGESPQRRKSAKKNAKIGRMDREARTSSEASSATALGGSRFDRALGEQDQQGDERGEVDRLSEVNEDDDGDVDGDVADEDPDFRISGGGGASGAISRAAAGPRLSSGSSSKAKSSVARALHSEFAAEPGSRPQDQVWAVGQPRSKFFSALVKPIPRTSSGSQPRRGHDAAPSGSAFAAASGYHAAHGKVRRSVSEQDQMPASASNSRASEMRTSPSVGPDQQARAFAASNMAPVTAASVLYSLATGGCQPMIRGELVEDGVSGAVDSNEAPVSMQQPSRRRDSSSQRSSGVTHDLSESKQGSEVREPAASGLSQQFRRESRDGGHELQLQRKFDHEHAHPRPQHREQQQQQQQQQHRKRHKSDDVGSSSIEAMPSAVGGRDRVRGPGGVQMSMVGAPVPTPAAAPGIHGVGFPPAPMHKGMQVQQLPVGYTPVPVPMAAMNADGSQVQGVQMQVHPVQYAVSQGQWGYQYVNMAAPGWSPAGAQLVQVQGQGGSSGGGSGIGGGGFVGGYGAGMPMMAVQTHGGRSTIVGYAPTGSFVVAGGGGAGASGGSASRQGSSGAGGSAGAGVSTGTHAPPLQFQFHSSSNGGSASGTGSSTGVSTGGSGAPSYALQSASGSTASLQSSQMLAWRPAMVPMAMPGMHGIMPAIPGSAPGVGYAPSFVMAQGGGVHSGSASAGNPASCSAGAIAGMMTAPPTAHTHYQYYVPHLQQQHFASGHGATGGGGAHVQVQAASGTAGAAVVSGESGASRSESKSVY